MTRPRDRHDTTAKIAPSGDRSGQRLAADLISHDMVLEGLIFSANAEGQEYGITVTVGGTVVSGVLSGDAEFIRFLAAEITTEPENADSASLRDDLEATADRTEAKLRQVLTRPRKGETRPIPLMPTLHLRDATIWLPGGQSVQVPYWRGRVQSVDGWFLGIIGSRPDA